MQRVFLLPLVGLGAVLLVTEQAGASALPPTVLGVPTPMVVFAGLSIFILSMLRTT
jgi:hypothetical protein